MEIGLIAYVLYASVILIWCSASGDSMEFIVISPALLEQWRKSRFDMIVFDLCPEGGRASFSEECCDSLTVTPSSLQGLIEWIPPVSTVVFRNRGVSARCMQQLQRLLVLRTGYRVFWLDEAAEGISARICGRETATQVRWH